jgi:hypothetical protein
VKVAEREGSEMRLGDLGQGMRGKRWHVKPPVPPVPPVAPVPPVPQRWSGLEDRIHELELRLQELEGRLPNDNK